MLYGANGKTDIKGSSKSATNNKQQQFNDGKSTSKKTIKWRSFIPQVKTVIWKYTVFTVFTCHSNQQE